MINVELNGTSPQHVERIKPQFSVDRNGNINWVPGLVDYDAALFYRGKTVTNDEFNTLFLQDVYQGNYLTDSLTELFEKHLGTAIYRTFTSDFNLVPSYVKTFSASDWGMLQPDGYYYITIPASEHGFELSESGNELDKMNIDTEMYLLGEDGKFYEVTQVDTDTENTVRIYTDDNTLSGFVVIRTNDKAYALASATIEASQIKGLANVATSAKYVDLIDIDAADGPNTKIRGLAKDISDIVEGNTVIGEAVHANKADEATRLLTNSYIQNIKVSDIFETGSHYAKDATRAKDYDTTAGGIKTKFDNIEDDINSKINQVKEDYYKKTDVVTLALNAAKSVYDFTQNVYLPLQLSEEELLLNGQKVVCTSETIFNESVSMVLPTHVDITLPLDKIQSLQVGDVIEVVFTNLESVSGVIDAFVGSQSRIMHMPITQNPMLFPDNYTNGTYEVWDVLCNSTRVMCERAFLSLKGNTLRIQFILTSKTFSNDTTGIDDLISKATIRYINIIRKYITGGSN